MSHLEPGDTIIHGGTVSEVIRAVPGYGNVWRYDLMWRAGARYNPSEVYAVYVRTYRPVDVDSFGRWCPKSLSGPPSGVSSVRRR